jgi:PKD repeat protein
VKLRVTSNYGCVDSVSSDAYVYPVPVSGFSINDSAQCLSGNHFFFTSKSTIPSGSLNYLWQFGDTYTSFQANPDHIYNIEKRYAVKLVVSSDNACKDSTSVNVDVYPMPKPLFFINDNTQCFKGNSFVFTNGTTISSGTVSYLWNFGDNQTSTMRNVPHSYATTDTFVVKLHTTSNYGCIDSSISNVIVYPMPTASFSINDSTQCLRGNLFVFTNKSSVPYGTLNNIWQFGDNSSSGSFNPSHTYNSFKTYTVKLKAVSDNQCSDSSTVNVIVYPMPKAIFNINDTTQCVNNNKYSFSNLSTIPSGTITPLWLFGDTSSSTANNPVHTYATEGTYGVKLIAQSNFACLDSVTKNVIVYPKPIIFF